MCAKIELNNVARRMRLCIFVCVRVRVRVRVPSIPVRQLCPFSQSSHMKTVVVLAAFGLFQAFERSSCALAISLMNGTNAGGISILSLEHLFFAQMTARFTKLE